MNGSGANIAKRKMAVHGLQSFLNGAGFAVPRSLIPRVGFGFGPSVSISQSANHFVFTDTSNPSVHVVATLHPTLWGARSYPLTLDHMLVDWWLLVDPNPNPQDLNVSLYWGYNVHPLKPDLLIFISGWTNFYYFNTPAMPSTYWLPPLL